MHPHLHLIQLAADRREQQLAATARRSIQRYAETSLRVTRRRTGRGVR